MRLDSPEVIQWLLLALPIALCAAQFMPGRYGLTGNLGVAAVGGMAGGLAAGLLRLGPEPALVASILATVAGAVVATRAIRALPERSRA